jgi:hypothetical protein
MPVAYTTGMSAAALAALFAVWAPLLPPAPEPAPGFFFAPEEQQRVLPRDAVARIGLVGDRDMGEAAAAFTAAARQQGQEVVPLPAPPGPLEASARQLAATYRVDVVARLRVTGGAAVVELWSKNGAGLGPLTSRPPPTAEERERARLDAEYAHRRLDVSPSQQFLGDDKRPLSRHEFYGLVGRKDLAEKEEDRAVLRGALIGVGITAGGVGLTLELVQLVFYAVVAPIDIVGCEASHALSSHANPYGAAEHEPCNGPELSPVPLVIALGGGVMALTAAAISSDAASTAEREALARAYNLRLRETLDHPQSPRGPAPITVGVSAAAVPEGGMLVLRGRF